MNTEQASPGRDVRLNRAFAALGVLTTSLATLAQPVASVPTPQERLATVQVTGSMLRRIESEGALPLQIWGREQIARSGATSVTGLLALIPAMQGGVPDATSAGGATYGYTTASIHNLGESRTLVLLNGRRLSQFGGQYLTGFGAGVDLSAIPLAAIERVEVLTDGASSLYGADAVAGVVNFITRSTVKGAEATVGLSAPNGGGQEKRFSLTQGWGEIAQDGRQFMLSLSGETREALYAAARPYARSGVRNVIQDGKSYQVVQAAGSSIPANVIDDNGNFVSPFFLQNGRCPERHVPVRDAASQTTACFYDFVGDLAMLPARERLSALATGRVRVAPEHTLSADLLLSRSTSKFQLAPVPGGLPINAGSDLHNRYLLPLGITQDTVAFYRSADLGPRAGKETADFAHLALSAEGLFAGWDYQAAWGWSRSEAQSRIKGYPGARAYSGLLASGLLNPFVGPGQQNAAATQALRGVAYEGPWDGGRADLQTLELRGNRAVAQWDAGPVMLGLGASHFRERYVSRPSLFAQGVLADPVTGQRADPAQGLPGDVRFGDSYTVLPYSAARRVSSAFGELSMPLTRQLEVTASGRLDRYSDFGGARTAKATFRWQPSSDALLRGSLGTGFRAPSVPQVNAALQPFGATASVYDCSPALLQLAQSQGAVCRPNGSQYEVLGGGNADLKPERSRQLSLGWRLEPSPAWTVGADFWHVGLRDVVSQLTEDVVFANPAQYASAFTAAKDAATGTNYIAFKQLNQNLGKEFRSGIDLDLQTRWRSSLGQWRSQLLATYLLRQAQQLTPGGPYYSAIGNNAELGRVAFRWQGRLVTTLQRQDWRHTVALNFKSGYRDAAVDAERFDAQGQLSGQFEKIRAKVPWSHTVDWQSAWQASPQVQLVVGLLNVFDRAPPLVLSNGGLDRGQNFGYDDRYFDPRGRVFYANMSVKF